MRQQIIDFEALEANAGNEEVRQETLTDSPSHPDLIRPDRQEVFPEILLSDDWPSPHHDRDTISIDRVHGSHEIGLTHRFTIKRGDTVKVSYGKDKHAVGQVVGISHVKNQVRVRYPQSVGNPIWIQIAYVYPEPEPTPIEPTLNEPASMSNVIESVNSANEPEGGFTDADIVHPPYSYDDFLEYLKLKEQGSATFADYQTQFKRLSNSEDAITSELKSRYNAKQLKALAFKVGVLSAGRDTKALNAQNIYDKMLSAFLLDGIVSFPMGQSYLEAVQQKVEAVSEDDWNAHKQHQSEQKVASEKALSDPQDLDEFRKFIVHHGVAALSNKQIALYDNLHAQQSRKRRAEQKLTATVTQFESEELREVEFSIKKGYHTKRKCGLWIVQLGSRVAPPAFKELKIKAKMLGGWWSNFIRADAGFQFLDQEAAERFTALLHGDEDRTDILEDRRSRKEQTASERLHELAETMLTDADAMLERSDQAKQNTVKRAREQAGVRGTAYRMQAMARTMHSVATSLSQGGCTFLDGMQHRTQFGTLDIVLDKARSNRIAALEKENGSRLSYRERTGLEEQPLSLEDIRFAEYPFPYTYKTNLEDTIAKCSNTKGLKQLSAKMAKRINREDNYITFTESCDIERLSDFVSRAKSTGHDTQYLEAGIEKYNRLRRANIHTLEELRAALREYLPHKASTRGDDPVRVAERELIGKKLPGFFPTPMPIIDDMLEYAEIESGHSVLEPSCGKGDIVAAILNQDLEVQLTAIEQNRTLADILNAKNIDALFEDFLDHTGLYDRIVMNPPFEQGQDIEHVRHAYERLVPGGRLVSIMSEGPFFRQDKKSTEFRTWLDEVNGNSEKLPGDAFNSAAAFRQTGVQTRILTIQKPAAQERHSLTIYIDLTENALLEISGESLHNMRWEIRCAIEERGIAEVIGSGAGMGRMDIGMEVENVDQAKQQLRELAAEFSLPNVSFSIG